MSSQINRKIRIILMAGTGLLFFLLPSCRSDSILPDPQTQLKNFPLQELQDQSVASIHFVADPLSDPSGRVWITGTDAQWELLLKVNGNDIPLIEYTHQGHDGYHGLAEIYPGQYFTYSLSCDGHTESGRMGVPDTFDAEFAGAWDGLSDLTLQWSMSESPHLFLLEVSLMSADGSSREFYFPVYATRRSFTITEDHFSVLAADELLEATVTILAVQYQYSRNEDSSGMLFWTTTSQTLNWSAEG